MEKIKRPWKLQQAWFRIDHSNVSRNKKTNKQTNKRNSIQYGKIKTSGIPLLNELFV